MSGTEPSIVAADDVDLRAIARRRCPDVERRREYETLAMRASSGIWVGKDEGTPIAIGFAQQTDDECFLSELFVEPSFRRQGVGSALLARLCEGAESAARAAVLDVAEPAAAAFALRHGLALREPLLRFAGQIPREEQLARMASGEHRFRAEPIDLVVHAAAIDALDRVVRAGPRRADHLAFAQAASGHGFWIDDEFAGYAYVWPDGRVGPVAAWSPAYVAAFLAFALMTLVRRFGASWCSLLVPGSNLRAARAALRIGLSVGAVAVFASEAPTSELARYVGRDDRCF